MPCQVLARCLKVLTSSEACAPRQLDDSMLRPEPVGGGSLSFPGPSLTPVENASQLQTFCQQAPLGPMSPERSPRPPARQGQAQVTPVRVSGQGPGHWRWPWLAPDDVSSKAFHLSLGPLDPGQNSFPFKRANDLLFPCLLP